MTFGQNKTGFGQQAQQQPAQTGMFGAKPPTGGFGVKPTTGFGAQPQQQNAIKTTKVTFLTTVGEAEQQQKTIKELNGLVQGNNLAKEAIIKNIQEVPLKQSNIQSGIELLEKFLIVERINQRAVQLQTFNYQQQQLEIQEFNQKTQENKIKYHEQVQDQIKEQIKRMTEIRVDSVVRPSNIGNVLNAQIQMIERLKRVVQ